MSGTGWLPHVDVFIDSSLLDRAGEKVNGAGSFFALEAQRLKSTTQMEDLMMTKSNLFQRRAALLLLSLAAACGTRQDARSDDLPIPSESGLSLGSASGFAVLGASAVTCTNASTVTGDVGVSPGTVISGFNPDCTLTGTIHAEDPVVAQAHDDLLTTYNGLEAVACEHNLTGQDLGGQTLAPGVYCFDSSVGLTGQLTLDGSGNSNAGWIFQIGSTITTASMSSVVMAGGGQPCNVFWQVGSSATIGVGSAFQGNIIAFASITLNTGTSLVGRALALNAAVTMDHNNVSLDCSILGSDAGTLPPDAGTLPPDAETLPPDAGTLPPDAETLPPDAETLPPDAETVATRHPVNLGAASAFAILAKSGISTVPTSAITGNIGVSPAAATYITGFSLIADPSNVFSTSSQVTGNVYAADYTPPSPSNLTTAVSDMETAFTDAAGRAPDVTELGAGNIGGMNLAPGVYKWSTGVLIPTDVTLTGSATDIWIFQIAQDLTVSSATDIHLAGGALPKNIFWQVSGLVDLGTTAHLEGVVLTQTAVTLQTGASINGRLLAQMAVNIDSSIVVEPAP